MINLEFTEEEKNSLYYERFHHLHPRVQLKMEGEHLTYAMSINTYGSSELTM